MQKYDRTIKLFGEENFQKLQNTKIILLGVGGVGSFALDSLYNTGITNITIVDFDTYEESNMNRQLGSQGNIGRIKVEKGIYSLLDIMKNFNNEMTLTIVGAESNLPQVQKDIHIQPACDDVRDHDCDLLHS